MTRPNGPARHRFQVMRFGIRLPLWYHGRRMPNSPERTTRVLAPTEELIQESRRPADNVPELTSSPSLEPYAEPKAEAPFRLEVLRLVRELENEIHRLPGDQMDADEKNQLFPLLWEMARDEKIAVLVLTSALTFGEPQLKHRLGKEWLLNRLPQIKIPVLLGYLREAAPILGLELPGYAEKEKLDREASDQAIQESLVSLQHGETERALIVLDNRRRRCKICQPEPLHMQQPDQLRHDCRIPLPGCQQPESVRQ